ncbi:BadF-type ATPase [Cyclonatronum proteinivorum]|uniref:BadF-type ATPase n=1 Tax=Cyclonatronum proteinivorum TaxID=1457365 RepID=A0A345ULB0_9BACT|nr:acetate and sugar kinases/Hsc70/actin family protein [Cyclonatronum proteinivorum]AXJ01262.1 BadF-type ATPase [Cyclonatronum proteinivorum]
MTNNEGLSVGIDGGGSGSRFVFWYKNKAYDTIGPILQARLKPIDETAALIAQIIAHFSDRHQLPQPARITAGIAGAAAPDVSEALQTALQNIFALEGVRVMSDIAACFASNFRDETDGCAVVICGTGSVLVYCREGVLKVAGGFGPALNEYGSGRQLGRDFMTCLMSCMEKEQVSPEVKLILEKEGLFLNTRIDALKLLYSSNFNPASLAPVCLQLASTGHTSCRKIAEYHIESLMSLFEAAFKAKNTFRQVALHGGLFKNEWFQERLKLEVSMQYPSITIKNSYQDTARFLAMEKGFKVPVVCL